MGIHILFWWVLGCFFVLKSQALMAQHDPYEQKRLKMVQTIAESFRQTGNLTGIAHLSPRVEEAFKKVPRHVFIEENESAFAYCDRPLPIGYGQTISQPFIVALMTELLKPLPHHKVLEIGTGSGYQAAILSTLVKEVYSFEVIPKLAEKAQKRFQELGYHNIHVEVATDTHIWQHYAPYDGIIVTAAAERLPDDLLSLLKPGGRAVIPLGKAGDRQMLYLYIKDEQGHIHRKAILSVSFVPFKEY
jgi:protein-L-isoaspartate(D-aspartate) O-methyltransferase